MFFLFFLTNTKIFLTTVFVAIITVLLKIFIAEISNPKKCAKGQFLLPGMNSCHSWLTCSDVENNIVYLDTVLGLGAQKVVKEGLWKGYSVAVNLLNVTHYLDDALSGLNILQNVFYNQPKVIQLVGWCIATNNMPPIAAVVTEKYALGSANNIDYVLSHFLPQNNTLSVKFSLCYDFVQIINILHSHPDGPFVMCDANTPQKALSQFLLTDNLTLVLNDVDALPQVKRKEGQLIKCGENELFGDYVAPEQLWPYENESYDKNLMPLYDEKVDIWKIPDICNFLINDMVGSTALKLHLFNIHTQCKELDPTKRPTAQKVLETYEYVKRILKL